MEKQSPLLRLWELGKDDHGGLVGAICSASIGVLCGMLPYFAAAQIIIGFLPLLFYRQRPAYNRFPSTSPHL